MTALFDPLVKKGIRKSIIIRDRFCKETIKKKMHQQKIENTNISKSNNKSSESE